MSLPLQSRQSDETYHTKILKNQVPPWQNQAPERHPNRPPGSAYYTARASTDIDFPQLRSLECFFCDYIWAGLRRPAAFILSCLLHGLRPNRAVAGLLCSLGRFAPNFLSLFGPLRLGVPCWLSFPIFTQGPSTSFCCEFTRKSAISCRL